MQRVTILATNAATAAFEDFAHGDIVFTFARLTPDGPSQLIDGRAWVFVDWVLDDLSGLEMVRRLRADARTRDAHVTMVLDEDDTEDRRRAIKAGADDYAIAPLSRQVILDRVLAMQGNAASHRTDRLIECGELVINLVSEQARWQGRPISLRPNEFRVLRFLAENADRIFSREELIDALGKAGDPGHTRTVDVWVKRLRQGLRHAGAAHVLRTVHGKGYVLDRL